MSPTSHGGGHSDIPDSELEKMRLIRDAACGKNEQTNLEE